MYVVVCVRRDPDGRPLWIRDGEPRCSSSSDLVHPECMLADIDEHGRPSEEALGVR